MKYSKFVLFAITLMLIAGGISSCGNSASDEIKKVIETANDQCPVIYETGVVTGFDVDEDNKMIVVNYEIDDEKELWSLCLAFSFSFSPFFRLIPWSTEAL